MSAESPGTRADVGALAAALDASGLPCEVEAYGSLAILTPHAELPPLDAALRARVVAAARASGFTHVALELMADERARADTHDGGELLSEGRSAPVPTSPEEPA